jgi:DNA-binding transcriptional ArsR family regulator
VEGASPAPVPSAGCWALREVRRDAIDVVDAQRRIKGGIRRPQEDREIGFLEAPRSGPQAPLVSELDRAAEIYNHMVVDSLDATLAAVADPTRRSILRRLAHGPAAVGELARPFRMSQQAISKHLACLERAKLVAKRRRGRLHICTLNPAPLKEVADWTDEYRRFWEANFERLDDLLVEMKIRAKRKRS